MIKQLLFLIFIFPCFITAQTDSLKQRKLDSLTVKLSNDSARIYRFQAIRPYVHFDNRNSLINGTPVSFKGVQIGLMQKERDAFGIGIYAMSQKSRRPVATIDGTVSAQKSLTMNFITSFYLHSFIVKRYFDLNFPFEIGLGRYKINLSDSTGHLYKEVSGGIIPIGFGAQCILKPTKWVGISLLLGYRVVGVRNQNFNGFYSSIGLRFDIRQIFRDTKYRIFKKPRYRKQVKKILSS